MTASPRGTLRRRRLTLPAAGMAVACLALLALPAASTAAPAKVGPGAPGAGDPYFPLDGNGGYDARHYGVTLKLDTDTQALVGTVVMDAVATQGLSSFDLDLHGLAVDGVSVGGRPAMWARDGQELTVTPSRPLERGDDFRAVVRYHGTPGLVQTPDGFDNGWFATSDGASAVGEPPGTSTWMPVNEHPKDKALYDITVTVPKGKAAISNGRLTGSPRTVGGWTTWSWHHTHPMASYLVLLSVGTFDIRTSRTSTGIPVLDAVDPSLGGAADAALAREGEVIDTLSQAFGPYPFETAGGVVDALDTGFALETQSRPFYSQDFFHGSPDDAWVIAHEIGHQWFGDSVSLQKWQDIWLNEGFARYAEWIWYEHEGWVVPSQILQDYLDYVPADDPTWNLDISDPGPIDVFATPVYDRGALVLEALREQVGDDAFFRTLRTWGSLHRDGNGTTAQFISLAQRISRQDLTDLFDTWLFGTGKPASAPAAAGATALRSVAAARIATPGATASARSVFDLLGRHEALLHG